MKLSASRLRQDIYRILDEVLSTGVPVDIERRGRLLRIVPVEPPDRLRELPERPYLRTDPQDIVHVDWSGEWRP
jgi:antitoxin (DNA-binding transcriptional repressor) of toxin-antitoxin stability system